MVQTIPWLFRSVFPIAALLALGTAPLFGQEGKAPAPAPRPTNLETNSGKALNSHPLKDLEQSIFKPFRDAAAENSMDGILEPPQRPPAPPSKRAKEMMELRRDWAYMTPEEIINSGNPLNSEDPSKEEDPSKSLSPMERYIRRVYGFDDKPKSKIGRTEKNDPFDTSAPLSSTDGSAHGDSPSGLPSWLRDAQRNIKKAGSSSVAENPNKPSPLFPNIFASDRNEISPEEQRIHRQRMEEYRKFIGLEPMPVFGAELLDTTAKKTAIITSLPDSKPQSLQPNPTAGAPSRPLNPFLDSAAAKPQTTPNYVPPTPVVPDPHKATLPTQPTFEVPRRVF